MPKLFTIGHSNRELSEFLELLTRYGIQLLVDVRKMPRSRSNPQFNGPELERDLAALCIGYQHMESLTGFRRGMKIKQPNAWENKSFQAYAAYMQTPEFEAGIDTLISMAETQAAAIMCSEAVWWRCHRRMIADAMVARGWEVRHILARTAAPAHELTRFARLAGGRVSYPNEASAAP